jgi:hypothetical protein
MELKSIRELIPDEVKPEVVKPTEPLIRPYKASLREYPDKEKHLFHTILGLYTGKSLRSPQGDIWKYTCIDAQQDFWHTTYENVYCWAEEMYYQHLGKPHWIAVGLLSGFDLQGLPILKEVIINQKSF